MRAPLSRHALSGPALRSLVLSCGDPCMLRVPCSPSASGQSLVIVSRLRDSGAVQCSAAQRRVNYFCMAAPGA